MSFKVQDGFFEEIVAAGIRAAAAQGGGAFFSHLDYAPMISCGVSFFLLVW